MMKYLILLVLSSIISLSISSSVSNSIIKINGLKCNGCINSVKSALLSLDGIINADVNLLGNYCNIEHDTKVISQIDIYNHLSKTLSFQFSIPKSNKTISVLKENANDNNILYQKIQNLLMLSVLVSILNAILNAIKVNNNIVVSVVLATISYAIVIQYPMIPLIIHFGVVASFLAGLVKIVTKTSHSHCIAIHDFDTSIMMILTFLLGQYLGVRAKKISNELLVGSVSNFIPSTAKKFVSYNTKRDVIEVPAETLNPGDICLLSPGEKVPADGVVVEVMSDCSVDESLLTGESTEVVKKVDSECFAGTQVIAGNSVIRVTASDSDTTLGKIANIVADNTLKYKTNLNSKVDQLSSLFFPVVSIWSLTITLVWYILLKYKNVMSAAELATKGGPMFVAINFGLSTIAIACPCALSLAIPVAVTVAVSIAARNKIILRDTKFLDKQQDTFVFDKTGTLTTGALNVIESHIINSQFLESDIYEMINLIEGFSKNKLGDIIYKYSKSKISSMNWNVDTKSVTIETNGIEADVISSKNGNRLKVMIGAESFFPFNFNNDDNNKKLVSENYSKGNSIVFMTINGILANILVLGDTIKSDASMTIKYLKQNGMDVYIASGDNDATVQSIASQLNIQSANVKGSLRPEDKTKLVKNLQSQGKTVVFIGDGFNDSPALIESDIGIAMASGVELSLYSASIVLQSNKLLDITRVCELLKLVKNVIDKNLFFAFLYNTMTIPVASGLFYRYGIVLNPSLCSLLMALSSLSIMISSFNMSHQYEKRIKDNKHLHL